MPSNTMYCQECGSEIRVNAKFCNSCGTQVRQRFGNVVVPPPPQPPPPPPELPKSQPLSVHAWPNAEEAIVMPAIGGGKPRKDEMPTRLDLPAPGISTDKNRAPQTNEMKASELPATIRNGSRDLKPFFTQVGTAVTNRQHNRLFMVVPILLLLVILLFVFAYIASK